MTLDEEIRKLKRQLKDLKVKVSHESDRAYKWLQYSEDLEAKLKEATYRLRLISTHHFLTNEGDEKNSIEVNAQITAACGLQNIARMKARKP